MDKNELLKYLICEIDLVMHDKDYRFENEDGTWYSRESCKNLTNEEVFEELKSELRQLAKIEDDFADLETKLAESEKALEYARYPVARILDDLAQLKQQLIEECKEHQEFCKVADEKVKELKQQLAEKEKEIEKLKIILSMQAVQVPEEQRLNLITTNCIQYNPNQTAIAELEKVKDKINAYKKEQCLLFVEWDVIEKAVEFIDQQIAELKGEK